MVKTGQAWSGVFVSLDASGALATPSTGPIGALYVDGTVNGASVTITGSNPYKWTVTLPSLTSGQCVSMYITATIATIATANVVAEDVADTVALSDVSTALADVPTVAEFEARTLAAADYTVVSDLGTVQTGDAFARLGAPAGASVSADVAAVKSDTAAILEDTGTTLPASIDALSAQISAIGSGTGAALNFSVTDDNADAPLAGVTAVGTQTGTFANTLADDGTTHQIASVANAIDWVYLFEVGAARAASKIDLRANMSATGDTTTVSAYNFLTTGWDTRKTITGTTETLYDIPLLAAHTGTGANEGKVYIRFQFSEGDAGTLVIDEAYVQAQQSGSLVGYVDGIEVDTVSGTAGTVPYVNGTKDNPVDSWADALTLSTLTNIKQFKAHGGSSITLTGDSSDYEIVGWAYDLALGGQTITNAHIVGARVTGIGVVSGTAPVFEYCGLGAVTLGPARLYQCGLGRSSGTFTAGSAGQFVIVDCFSLVPGSGTPVFSFAGTGDTTGVNFRRWSGGSNITGDSDVTATVEVVTGGGQTLITGGGNFELRGICRAVTITLTGGETVQVAAVTGPIVIDGVGTGSTVNLYGVHSSVANTASGSPTVNDYNAAQTGADGDTLETLSDQIDGTAEDVLMLDWTTISGAVPDRSALNALRFLRNKRAIATGTLTVMEEDDSTPAWTADVVGDAEASPITSIDPT